MPMLASGEYFHHSATLAMSFVAASPQRIIHFSPGRILCGSFPPGSTGKTWKPFDTASAAAAILGLVVVIVVAGRAAADNAVRFSALVQPGGQRVDLDGGELTVQAVQ